MKTVCSGLQHLPILLLMLVMTACTSHPSSRYKPDDVYRQEVKHHPYIELASRTVPEGIAEFSDLTYIQRDTQILQLDLYAPATTMDELRPGIVLVHGGDWLSGTPELVAPLAIQLALRGYVVAAIQYRLAPQARYPAAVEDAQAAVRWMRDNAKGYGIDASHIALGGVGAGGTVAALAGLTAGDREKVQVIFSYNSPWQLDAGPVKSETGHPDPVASWLSKSDASLPQLRHQASPANQIRKDMPAVFIMNSADQAYEAGTQEVLTRLSHFRVPHRAETIPRSPHSFWLFDPWVNPAANITADFLDLQFKYRMTCH
jgi:acetyl esterase/lipase